MLLNKDTSKKTLKKDAKTKIWPNGNSLAVLSSFVGGDILPYALFTQETMGKIVLGLSQEGERHEQFCC
jgi:hypothetical protein